MLAAHHGALMKCLARLCLRNASVQICLINRRDELAVSALAHRHIRTTHWLSAIEP